MKKATKILGLIALAAVIVFIFAVCEEDGGGGGSFNPNPGGNDGGNGGAGTLTLTGIPAQYNGMYAFYATGVVQLNMEIIGLENITITGGNLTPINNGRAVFNLWMMNGARYNGSHTTDINFIRIYQTSSISWDEEYNSLYMNESIVPIQFSNGSATRSWNDLFSNQTPSEGDITYTVTANGNANVTSTALNFTFSSNPGNLTENDITLSGVASMGDAILTGSGSTRTLSPIDVSASGNARVSITSSGIDSSTKNVQVFLEGDDDNLPNNPNPGESYYYILEDDGTTLSMNLWGRGGPMNNGIPYTPDQEGCDRWELDEMTMGDFPVGKWNSRRNDDQPNSNTEWIEFRSDGTVTRYTERRENGVVANSETHSGTYTSDEAEQRFLIRWTQFN